MYKRQSMYSPKSVVEAMLRHKFGTYWNQTETYEALKLYIQMDMDGLKASVAVSYTHLRLFRLIDIHYALAAGSVHFG